MLHASLKNTHEATQIGIRLTEETHAGGGIHTRRHTQNNECPRQEIIGTYAHWEHMYETPKNQNC